MYGRRPNELVVKKLGMVGCTAMILVHSIKDNKKLSSYAGKVYTCTNDYVLFWSCHDGFLLCRTIIAPG